MIKSIEQCYSVELLKEKRTTKENVIKESKKYIDECDLRISQLNHENKNQIKFKI